MTKQHILDEIRRTATANGGSPLGAARFYSATRIKESAWRGKFWARWSDALQEAGYAPNKMRPRHEDAYLIRQLIPLIRQLNKFPTPNDIRLWNKNHPGAPNFKTYFTHFGTKKGLVEGVSGYCRRHDEFKDVVELCGKDSSLKVAALSPDEKDKNSVIGYVYLIKSGRYYKIGKTNSIGRREYELSIQLPEKASTVHSISTDDPAGIEAYWHRRFDSKRKNGEWFELDILDVKAFRKRTFM